jgi:hypothetical protein
MPRERILNMLNRRRMYRSELKKIDYVIDVVQKHGEVYPNGAHVNTFLIARELYKSWFRDTELHVLSLHIPYKNTVELVLDFKDYVNFIISEDSQVEYKIELKGGKFYEGVCKFDSKLGKLPEEILEIINE